MAATNVARAGKRGNICVGNNVSSFARALTFLSCCKMSLLPLKSADHLKQVKHVKQAGHERRESKVSKGNEAQHAKT